MNSPIWTKIWEVLRDSGSGIFTFYVSCPPSIHLNVWDEFIWRNLNEMGKSSYLSRCSNLVSPKKFCPRTRTLSGQKKTLRIMYKMDIKRVSGTFMTFHTMHDQWMNYPQITNVYGIIYWQELGEGLWMGFKSWSQSSGSWKAFKKYLLNTYHVLSMSLGADNSSVRKQNSCPKFLFWWKRETMCKYAK